MRQFEMPGPGQVTRTRGKQVEVSSRGSWWSLATVYTERTFGGVSLEGSLERGQQQHAVEAGTATPVSRRSFERLQIEDLSRLAASAMENLNRFVGGNREKYGWCENHLLMLCLRQGATEHYVRRERGMKDFDVWAFYEAQTGGEAVPLATLQHRKLRALEVREKPV